MVFCEYSNESLRSIKYGKFLEELKDSVELIRNIYLKTLSDLRLVMSNIRRTVK